MEDNYAGKLLIAQPNANSTFFEKTVILVCEHNESKGAWGVIVNKPSPIPLRMVSESVNLDIDMGEDSSFVGGPVDTHSINILHSNEVEFPNTLQVTPDLSITSSLELMELIGYGRGPQKWRCILGISGWGPGQLEGEMSGMHPWTTQHEWLTMDAPKDLLTKGLPSLWQWCITESIGTIASKYLN